VKGLGSATIPRAAIRPVRNEQFCGRAPERRGSHVKSRVAAVKIMCNFTEKEGRCFVPGSANVARCSGKRGTGGQTAGEFIDVAVHDLANEIKKQRLRLWHGFLVRLSTQLTRGQARRRRLSLF
jgi:hypothetical protein